MYFTSMDPLFTCTITLSPGAWPEKSSQRMMRSWLFDAVVTLQSLKAIDTCSAAPRRIDRGPDCWTWGWSMYRTENVLYKMENKSTAFVKCLCLKWNWWCGEESDFKSYDKIPALCMIYENEEWEQSILSPQTGPEVISTTPILRGLELYQRKIHARLIWWHKLSGFHGTTRMQ